MADDMRLREIVGENRAKIDATEREVDRLRDTLHDVKAELAALGYLGREVRNMATAMRELSDKLELISRRALERPTAKGWSALASIISAGVAIIALIVAVRR